MSLEPLAREFIELALSSLHQDETLSEDSISGQFYERDGWFKNLPREAQAYICAVQQFGDRPDRPLYCSHKAAQYFAKWRNTKKIEELESAIAMYVIAIKYTRPDDPRRPDRLSEFAFACQAKWEQTDSIDDLDITVHFFRRAVIAAEPNHAALGAFCTNLAYILKQLWDYSKSAEHRQEAKDNFLRAIELSVDHQLLPQMLSNYGEFVRLTTMTWDVLRTQFLREAIENQERAVKLLRAFMPVPHGTIWRNAAIAHHTMFKITFDEDSSLKAVDYYKRSLGLTDMNDTKLSMWRNDFAEHYTTRYQRWGHIDDILEALRLYTDVLEFETRNFAAAIGKADALRMLADRDDDVAMSRSRLLEACQLADDSIELASEKSNSRGWAYFRTSVIYSCRYEADGDSHYMDRAVELSKSSLEYTEHKAFWDFGRWCGEVCRSRHVENGSPDDLDHAFKAVRAAIESLDEGDVANLASCSWVLGKCYTSQYKYSGKIGDLEETLRWLKSACLPVAGQEHTLALTQNDVANALCLQFHQTSLPEHLDKAIEFYALSIKNLGKSNLPANHLDFAMLQNGIGQAMLQRHLHWGSQDDLTSAVDSFRKSFSMTDARSPRLAGRVCNLSYSLQLLFSLCEDFRWLEEAQSYLLAVLKSSSNLGSQVLQSLHNHMGNIYL